MRLADSETLKMYQEKPTPDNRYDFYRCHKCGWLFTQAYERRARRLLQEEKQQGICKHCGSTRFSPSWPRFLGWLRPDVVVFVFKLIVARVVAPWADERAPWMLPRIERLVAMR